MKVSILVCVALFNLARCDILKSIISSPCDERNCLSASFLLLSRQDINECKEDPKLCSTVQGAVCANKLGSYECKCTQSGFRVNDKKTKCIGNRKDYIVIERTEILIKKV